MNGDGIPDIIAPPPAAGRRARLHIWIGDGKGQLHRRGRCSYVEDGKPNPAFSVDYGGVAVGRHRRRRQYGRRLRFARRRARLALRRRQGGVPRRRGRASRRANSRRRRSRFVDADGDGKLDIIASADTLAPAGRERPDAGPRLPLPGGTGLGVQGGRDRGRLLLELRSRLGLRRRREGRHPDRQPLHRRARRCSGRTTATDASTPVRFPESRSTRFHFATVARDLRAAARAGVRGRLPVMQHRVPRSRGRRASASTRFENGAWTRTASGARRTASPRSTRSPWETSTATAWTTSSSPTASSIGSGSSSRSRTAPSPRWPRRRSPSLDSPGQCVRLADVNRDGRLDIIVVQDGRFRATRTSTGGWNVYLNGANSLGSRLESGLTSIS